MGLTIPVVSQQVGPSYAQNINDSLSLVDAHNHSNGSGVQITPYGLNISSDLTFLNNNATTLRSARFQSQTNPIAATTPDLNCLSVGGVDLYYNDGNGNQIRLTQSGGIAGSPGSITGLVSPASVTYSAPTFVFQSDANVAASLDGRNLVLRNSGASSNGLTLQAPTLSTNFSITLPNLPASQSMMTIDNSGVIATPSVYPIISSAIAAGAVTRPKLAAVGQVISSATGTLTTTRVDRQLAMQTTPITTTGRPVMVLLQNSTAGANSYLQATTAGGNNSLVVTLVRTTGSAGVSTDLSRYEVNCFNPVADNHVPPSSVGYLDVSVSAQTCVYQVFYNATVGTQSVALVNTQLVAYEL